MLCAHSFPHSEILQATLYRRQCCARTLFSFPNLTANSESTTMLCTHTFPIPKFYKWLNWQRCCSRTFSPFWKLTANSKSTAMLCTHSLPFPNLTGGSESTAMLCTHSFPILKSYSDSQSTAMMYSSFSHSQMLQTVMPDADHEGSECGRGRLGRLTRIFRPVRVSKGETWVDLWGVAL